MEGISHKGVEPHTQMCFGPFEPLRTLWQGTGAEQNRRVFNMRLDNCISPFSQNPPHPPTPESLFLACCSEMQAGKLE